MSAVVTLPYIESANQFPIARYAQYMGLDLGHIFQVGGDGYPTQPTCQYCWTEDQRQQLRWAIAQAEEMIANQLRQPVGATYITEDQRNSWHYQWHTSQATLVRSARGRFGWPTLSTRWKNVRTMGSISLTARDHTFDWSCDDANGVALVGTLYVADADAAIDASRLRVFFTGQVPEEEIKGLRVRRNGDNIELAGFRPLWLLPDACPLPAICVEYSTDALFVGDLDDLVVYEETDHPEDGLCFIWSVGEDCEPCEEESQRGCVTLLDKRLGRVNGLPATWDGTTLTVTTPTRAYPPDRIVLRYRAGYRDPLRMFDRYDETRRGIEDFGAQISMAIVKLTNVLMPAAIRCGCDRAKQQWGEDRMLVGLSDSRGATGVSRPSIPEADRNPFGPTYGALAAWRAVKPFVIGGAAVG